MRWRFVDSTFSVSRHGMVITTVMERMKAIS